MSEHQGVCKLTLEVFRPEPLVEFFLEYLTQLITFNHLAVVLS
jgi:hypothetical protein